MKLCKNIILGLIIFFGLFNINAIAEGCTGDGCISSPKFTIDTKHFSPNGNNSNLTKAIKDSGGNTSNLVNNILNDFITKMLVVFGVLALLIMTIGGGYMIFHLGEESLLSRGKTIFMWGLISLAVVLSAGIMVNLVTYILY